MTRMIVAALAVTLAACAGPRAERGGSTEPAAANAAPVAPREVTAPVMAQICPMDVPGTAVSASDTPEGEALTFTTTSGQVDDLRRRVRALADMHNQHEAAAPAAPAPGAGQGTGSADAHGHGHGHHMMPPPSRATVDDVENGARVSIVPADPSQADRLRVAARMHAMHMQHHGCAMPHGGPAQR